MIQGIRFFKRSSKRFLLVFSHDVEIKVLTKMKRLLASVLFEFSDENTFTTLVALTHTSANAHTDTDTRYWQTHTHTHG